MMEETWKKYIADQATLKEVRDMIANGRVVKSVQRGVASVGGNGSATYTVNIAAVNLDKSDITFKGDFTAVGTTDIPTYQIRMSAWTPTSLTFACNYAFASNTFVNWQVVEYY
ncbi:hypothetical protein [Lysinibacillus irui]|uniref:hypothetical protein n=1 Tax=Lysinibacillus irui TaxID=2998077 RepID=UPI002AD2FD54|nr:hypothetical protein [Lysinibacillus irui]MEA0565040.1 hypothetical protein [Lysinibacillus irui]